jgi:hypothetical protein
VLNFKLNFNNMQNTSTIRNHNSIQNIGKPTMPVGKQPVIERKFSDPSSSPKGERYPVPNFENRFRQREF